MFLLSCGSIKGGPIFNDLYWWCFKLHEWCARENLDEALAGLRNRDPAITLIMRATGTEMTMLSREHVDQIKELEPAETAEPHALTVRNLHIENVSSRSSHTLRSGSIDVVQATGTQYYMINKVLQIGRKYFALCTCLQMIRSEVDSSFPVFSNAGNTTTLVVKRVTDLGKPCIYNKTIGFDESLLYEIVNPW